MPEDRTPVITGMGVVSPLGRGVESLWEAVCSGRSGIGPVRSFDTSAFGTSIGAEVAAGFLPASYRDGDGRPLRGRAECLAALAACDALDDAGRQPGMLADLDVVVGTTMGAPTWIETWPDADAVRRPAPPAPAAELLLGSPDALARVTADVVGAGGRASALGGACAAGNYALIRALDDVRSGRSRRVLAGGVDAFSRTAFLGFAKLGALATSACRPFGLGRDGLVLGEGAAFLLVESRASARERGARERAVLAGGGMSCDAHHPTTPRPDGAGAARALAAALADAAVDTRDVDWVSAHGTGTRANDAAEVRALATVFGGGRRPPASSLKSLTGHGLGAASAIEAVACVLALERAVMPPTWHAGEQDPVCGWDVVPDGPRAAPLRVVVNQAYAFGGCNAVTVLTAPEPAGGA